MTTSQLIIAPVYMYVYPNSSGTYIPKIWPICQQPDLDLISDNLISLPLTASCTEGTLLQISRRGKSRSSVVTAEFCPRQYHDTF